MMRINTHNEFEGRRAQIYEDDTLDMSMELNIGGLWDKHEPFIFSIINHGALGQRTTFTIQFVV